MPRVRTFDQYRHMNRSVAREVAYIFLRHPSIQRVELFGSVARDGVGSDLDLILITDDAHALSFAADYLSLAGEENCCIYSNQAANRRAAAAEMFGLRFVKCLRAAEYLAPNALDIFVFPTNWRQHLDFLQQSFNHEDPRFMENIARDAVMLAP